MYVGTYLNKSGFAFEREAQDRLQKAKWAKPRAKTRKVVKLFSY